MKMSIRPQMGGLIILAMVLLGCGGRSTPAPVAQAHPPAAPTLAAPAVAGVTTTTLTLTSVPVEAPIEDDVAPFFAGVPAGDSYRPGGLAVDATRGKAYVHQVYSETGTPVISVVDLSRGEVERLISLDPNESSLSGELLLSPDGALAYALDSDQRSLKVVDLTTDALGPSLEDVQAATLSPDGSQIYVAGAQSLRAYDAHRLDVGALWSVPLADPADVSAAGDRVAVTVGGIEPAILLYNARDGAPLERAPLPGYPQGLAAGPKGGWAVRTGLDSLLTRFDRSLQKAAVTPVPYGEGLYYDALSDRYIISGYTLNEREPVVWALRAEDLSLISERVWPSGELPGLFAAVNDDRLVAAPRWGLSRLSVLDRTTLEPAEAVILGVALTDMALDAGHGVLYVADDQDRVHVFGLSDGRSRAVWEGSAPIELDAENGRLYVNRVGGVTALDVRNGEAIARFPLTGLPAPDPNRDLVYIAAGGVTMYDRAGSLLGRLPSTFPAEGAMNPIPSAVAAWVNPVTGYLTVVMNNGVPGSSNRSYLRFYPPQSDEGIEPPSAFSFAQDLVFDPKTGESFVSYNPAMNLEAVQRLSGVGEEVARLAGRTGWLSLDPRSDALYALEAGALAVLDRDALELRSVNQAPMDAQQTALDSVYRKLYIRSSRGPRLSVLDLEALEPFDMTPRAADHLTEEAQSVALQFGEADNRILLYLTNSANEHYRAAVTGVKDAGQLQWERLPVGSLQSLGYLTVLDDGLVFRSGAGNFGGDGVWRSRDSGDSWELLASGLADLRASQEVPALDENVAYFVSRTAGIYAWRDADSSRWERIVAPESAFDWPGNLYLAPDGTLFLQSYDELKRSGDGRTWQSLSPPAESGAIAGFHPDYARNRTLFSLFCSVERCGILRSQDAGESWDPVLPLPAYSAPFRLQTDGKTLYLFNSGYPAPQLYRSTNDGASWQAASAADLTDVGAVGVAPDGALWLGERGRVRVLSPKDISWTDASLGEETRGVTETATLTPSQTVSSVCVQGTLPVDRIVAGNAPALGCAVSQLQTLTMARQAFERGQMVWERDARSILVLRDDGTWQGFTDDWSEGQPSVDATITVPEGLVQPARGFGKVWREQLGGPEAEIGWAFAPEQGIEGESRFWQNGRTLRFGDEWLALYADGRWTSFTDSR